jgi:endonuclease/exonuclease/phosphatase family metal-dependent hydrolase
MNQSNRCVVIISLFLFVHFLSASFTFAKNVKVLTWNVQMMPSKWSFLSKELQKKQQLRTQWILSYIKQNDFDIVFFQEAFDAYFLKVLSDSLAAQYPYRIAPHQGSGIKLSNGLWTLSKFPITNLAHITYEAKSYPDLFAAKGAQLLCAEVESQKIFFINTHLQADDAKAKHASIRQRQLLQIKAQLITPFIHASDALICTGDYNIAAASEEHRHLKDILGLHDIIADFKMQLPTFSSKNYWNKGQEVAQRLDYFLSNLIALWPLKESIQLHTPSVNYKGQTIDMADHYGLGMTFEIANAIARNP